MWMGLLICAATAKELAAMAPKIFPQEKAIPEMRPIAVEIKGGDAVFLVTGVGIINAAMSIGFSLGLTLESRPLDGILYIGLTGAFDLEKNPLCSIWRVREEIWPEYGLNDGVRITARAFSHPLWRRDNGEEIYDRLPLADVPAICPDALPEAREWAACTSLTVAGVSASFNRRNDLWTSYHAELENMEGFAAAYVAARASLPCVEIRVVSNKVGPRGKNEKDFDGALSVLGEILPALNLV